MIRKGNLAMRSLRRESTLQLAALALLVLVGTSIMIGLRQPGATPDARASQERLSMAAEQRSPTTTADLIGQLQQRIRRAPNDVQALALLGGAYVQRSRETGDPSYYSKAEAVLATAQRLDPHDVETLIGQGTLALARHDFAGALALGEQARAINPDVPRIYGVIGDAQIELGRYDEAVETIQTMVDRRPDLSSYSRVSYVRELHGDLSGATEAMQAAVTAGGPNAENTQWLRVQLGTLAFNQGDLATAEQHYQRALTQLPGYVPATAGLARVRAAQGRNQEAVTLYTTVTEQMPLPEYVIALGDLYTRLGDTAQAQQQYQLVQAMDALLTTNGVNTDLETALFFADQGLDLDSSLTKAQAAYAAHPNIHAADALAWTLYKHGRYADAQRYSAEALRLGTRDSLKLFHAGMIANAAGQTEQARDYLQQALTLNPHFSLRYEQLAVATLDELAPRLEGRP